MRCRIWETGLTVPAFFTVTNRSGQSWTRLCRMAAKSDVASGCARWGLEMVESSCHWIWNDGSPTATSRCRNCLKTENPVLGAVSSCWKIKLSRSKWLVFVWMCMVCGSGRFHYRWCTVWWDNWVVETFATFLKSVDRFPVLTKPEMLVALLDGAWFAETAKTTIWTWFMNRFIPQTSSWFELTPFFLWRLV